MNVRTFSAVIGTLLAGGAAFGADLPPICKSTINYAVQAAAPELFQGQNPGDAAFDPDGICFDKNFDAFPITKSTEIGNCEEQKIAASPACRVFNGLGTVYQAEVSKKIGSPLAQVVVTFNRGGCRLVSLQMK